MFEDAINRPKNKIQRAKKYIFLFGGVGYVIGGLRRMEPQDTGAKGQIRKLIGYLD
jgi:hypothetical protein